MISAYGISDRRFDGDFDTCKNARQRLTRKECSSSPIRHLIVAAAIRANSWKESLRRAAGVFFDLGRIWSIRRFNFSARRKTACGHRIEREGGLAEDAFDLTLYYKNGLRRSLRQACWLRSGARIIAFRGRVALREHTLDPQEALLRADHRRWEMIGEWSRKDWGTMTLWSEGDLRMQTCHVARRFTATFTAVAWTHRRARSPPYTGGGFALDVYAGIVRRQAAANVPTAVGVIA